MTKDNYNFGEKKTEKAKVDGKFVELKVWQSPKYLQSKTKAIELIEKGDYYLNEADFWILMNRGGDSMIYSGLILSHNGCLKINAGLDAAARFKPSSASVYKDQGGSIVMSYINEEQGIYEFGEISPSNCKNEYPYAMALKRLQDRVILKNSKVAFFGIYSDSESEEFRSKEQPEKEQVEEKKNAFGLSKEAGERVSQDMKETQQLSNKETADRLVAKIKGMGSTTELEGWIEKKEVQSAYAKLEKYAAEDFARVKKEELAKFNELDPGE